MTQLCTTRGLAIGDRTNRQMEQAFRIACCVALCGVAGITSGGQAVAAKSPCALSNPASIVAQPPCSPYATIRPHIIATFAKSRFFGIGPLTTLADGSAVIADAPYALFRIRGDQIGVMWAPWGSRYYEPYRALNSVTWIGSPPPQPSPSPIWTSYYFFLLGSFDNTTVIQYGDYWIYGIGTDGSTAFRFSRAGTDWAAQPTFLGRDPGGTLWFVSGSKRFGRNTVYAVDPKTKTITPLTTAVENVFQGPSGFVYATLDKNLVVLHRRQTSRQSITEARLLSMRLTCTALLISMAGRTSLSRASPQTAPLGLLRSPG